MSFGNHLSGHINIPSLYKTRILHIYDIAMLLSEILATLKPSIFMNVYND